MEQNSPEKTIETYLRHYHEYATYIENLKDEITERKAVLKLTAAPVTSRLSAAPLGTSDTSQEERITIEKEQAAELLQGLQLELMERERMKRKIDRTLDSLTEADRAIVWGRYVDGVPFLALSFKVNCSPSTCRRRLPAIVHSMAVGIYGIGLNSPVKV